MRPVLLLAVAGSLWGQNAGLAPEWDVRANMKALGGDVRKLQPLIQQVNAREWVAKGASETYVKQAQSAAASLQHLIAGVDELAAQPEKLTVALDAFFRMEKMELLLGSLKDGVRRYQSPALADQFVSALAANIVHRDRLRQHVSELAAAKEQEFEIVDREAQRCRGAISREGAVPTSGSGASRQRKGQERR